MVRPSGGAPWTAGTRHFWVGGTCCATAFEIEVFFPELKLGHALQIRFLRMSGRLLDAVVTMNSTPV
jgi:hypothetical protein